MPKNKRLLLIGTKLRCLNCGTIQTIQRIRGRERKKGHVKHLWCIACKDRMPHEEMR